MVLPLLFGALAPGLLSGMSPVLAASLGAGVGGAIQSGDLETGLLTGLGAFAGGSLLGPMLGGGGAGAAGAAGGAGGAGSAGAAASSAAPTAAVAKAAEAANAVSAANAAANPAMSATSTPGGLGSLMSGPAPGSTASMLGTPGGAAAGAAKPGMLRGAMDFAKSPTGTGVGIGSMAGPALAPLLGGGGSGGGGSKKSKYAGKEMRPITRNGAAPPEGYRPGVDGEFDYGLAHVPSAGEIIDFRDRGVMPYSDGGLLLRYQQMMGPVKMAAGGIATLAETDGGQPQAAPVGGNEKDVVVGAVQAIKGQSPNPEVALAIFVKTYGEDALRQLVDQVQSGEFDQNMGGTQQMSGPGDGMDDMIPASIDGQQDVLLSDGEFVIPSDVVSGLGNGSTDAGARALMDMMDRVRSARTGTPQQPPKVPQGEVLPV